MRSPRIDELVYGMLCAPDGGLRYVEDIKRGGQVPPKVSGPLFENEAIKLLGRFVEENPSHFAVKYVTEILSPYVAK